ncbi:uncharacterized protein LOC124414413 [Diprion similis]|uniref:uncharacterized protein LOC124414413 n=1 Tax=Diprion similis TaxID=362088 RepID=UPI001EF8CABB|nr:uncharacterized protein LOC124414413 [Diprion similis]
MVAVTKVKHVFYAFKSQGPFVFRICGQTYNNTYALHPDVNESRKYGQLYIVDNEIATRVRMQHPGNSGCLPEVLSVLDDVIRRVNPYAKAFNMMYEVERNEILLSNLTVAVVFVAEDGDPPLQRDIFVYSKSKGPISMSSLSQHVDPMTYPLIFPSGQSGCALKMKQTGGKRDITALQYYSFMLSDRGGFNPCLSMGSSSQQYIVDMWTKVESHCLYFMRNQQSELRAETYEGVIDYLHNKAGRDNARIGKMPKWKEYVENLKPGQTAMDRPDLIARVFCRKVKELKAQLIVEAVFGKCAAYVYEDSKIRDADDVDRIVSAEIPDKTRYPLLHDIVRQCMVHGPCGQQNVDSPCMDTKTNRWSSRIYRRRDDGNLIVCDVKEDGTRRTANNRDVVPYNAYLLLKFNSHINVEICSMVQCIKYLFKYCYKGHDCAIVEMENVQEDCNIILSVHIEGEQVVYFEESNEEITIDKNKESTLLAWFTLNTTDIEALPVLSRMYFVSREETERYYLRVLLLHVRGAQSFQDVRTYGSIMYPTYLEAAVARKLVTDDEEWDKCLSEASRVVE